jgi:RHS repeat-associated protein
VKEISFTAWDPDLDTPAMRTVPMAAYSYDTSGRLRATWDPRIPTRAKETYEYQADGVLSVIKPPGEEPWQLSYTTVPGDTAAGRLHKVTRSALAAGTATTTVGYKVPLSGSGAPNDLSPAQTKRWGQLEAPTDATAIFPADQAPGGWERTTVSYLDANGRLANTATPGGHLTTNWYDGFGNVVRSLTAENRARALNQSPSDDDAAERVLAQKGSTLNTYSLDGLRLESTSGPETEVQLGNGTLTRGRQVVRNTYDQGAPTSGGPYNLVTTEETQVRHWGANGTEVVADSRVTSTAYNWALREPTVTTTDPGGLSQTTRTAFDPVTGLPTSTTQPAGGATTNTPATRKTIYYRATAGSGFAECDLRPEWANLACRVQPGGQAASGPELAATVTTYDMLNQPRVKVEKTSAGTLRTTTISYDPGGRVLDKQVTASVGTAVPVERNVYDPVTGLLLKSQSVVAGNVTAEIVRGYDTLGRVTSYKDADGNVSTTEYDLLGRQSKTTDGKGTRTYTYDYRGFLTSVADSMTGTYTGDYNADGKLVTETWPNGVKVETALDESGTESGITYSKPGCPVADCVLFREALTRTGHGQTAKRVSTLSSQTYQQDKAGRVTTVEDTVGERCTTRTYGFNTASDRTTSAQYGPAGDGSCQSGTPAALRSWSYDTADRVSTAGYGYDALGRTITVPAVDTAAPEAGAVMVGYHASDLVDTITQGGRTTDYTIDVTSERVRSWTDAAVQRVHHYDGDDDKPVWTQEGPERSTRIVAGLAGMTAIVDSDSGVPEWQVSDLSGDVVATIHDGEEGLSTTSEADEYGQVRDPEAVGKQRYGWLGAEQRAADAPSGIVLMGVRLYNPTTGRFLQTDPVYGGSCNAYEYTCADPVDKTDLDGKKAKKKKWQPVYWPGHVWRFGKWLGGKVRKIWNGYWGAVWRFHKWGFKQYRNLGRWTWKQTKRGWRKLFG